MKTGDKIVVNPITKDVYINDKKHVVDKFFNNDSGKWELTIKDIECDCVYRTSSRGDTRKVKACKEHQKENGINTAYNG